MANGVSESWLSPGVLQKLATIGGWIVVSIFFMGQAAGYIPSPASTALEQVNNLNESLADHRVRNEVLNERIITALRVICENAASGAAELNNCRNIR